MGTTMNQLLREAAYPDAERDLKEVLRLRAELYPDAPSDIVVPDRPAGMDIARAVDRDEIDAAATKQWQRANGFSNEQAAIESGFRAGVRWALEREKGLR